MPVSALLLGALARAEAVEYHSRNADRVDLSKTKIQCVLPDWRPCSGTVKGFGIGVLVATGISTKPQMDLVPLGHPIDPGYTHTHMTHTKASPCCSWRA